jgi:ABC-type glycerol-3-phosphate transport system permease component
MLSLGPHAYQSPHRTAWTHLTAAVVVFILPVAILFLVAQRCFIQGIALSGLKV